MRVLTEKEDNMAVVPIYNRIIVPFSNIVIMSEHYTKVTGRIPNEGEKTVLILSKENLLREEFREDSFYPIGVTGVITEVNKSGYLVVRTSNRVNINEVTIYRDHTIDLDISKRKDTDAVDREEEALRLKKMKTAINSFSMQMPNGKGVMSAFLAQWTSIGEIAAAMSPWMMNTPEEKYSVLALDSARERLDLLERMVYENIETYKINSEAESAQKEEYQKVYRESAIRKQIEYLQKELDEMHPEEVSEIRKFEIRIEESGMNETARKEADKVLNRLKQEGSNSVESGILYDYLDFVTGLSWKKEKAETIDLDEAEQVLNETHYGLDKVKKRILEQIAVMNLKRMQAGSILLFVGAPGTGKTSIGQGIAQALNRKYVRVSLGGVRDEADIRGHRRTYIGAMPGRIMDGIAKSGVSNPVMVLDEVDKLSASYNGDPASALLEVLDPEQNNTFTDHYMNVPYDLSSVLFICTANSLDTVPAPLLDRMEVISFQGYTPFEKLQIAEKHLLPKAMRAVGIRSENLEVGEDVLNKIIADYTREAGVRTLKKRLDTLCRTAAVEIVRGNDKQLVIHENELRDYLDMRPISHGKVGKEGKPGVVTGLAWTQVGGEILFIETLMTRGTGKIIVTGQLGDVMKESSTIAISLVKSLYPEKAELFEKNDLHIHVPDGATPKDGPSAGITMTTALASLVTGIPVTPEAAMTGEISLQGDVRPIGGLPEKLMAAQRAGVRKVFIPAENEEDLRDVPKEVREELQIIPVRRAEDVLGALSLM
jgi:ATP-dependent Lon protease